jgi:hypothetical protein
MGHLLASLIALSSAGPAVTITQASPGARNRSQRLIAASQG